MSDETFHMTEKGWAIAADIWQRFVYEQEDVNDIAASYGRTVEEIATLMAMAFSGGAVTLGDD